MSRRVLEACFSRVSNKFELVLLASLRARGLATKGGVHGPLRALSARGRRESLRYQKPPVLALREIASGVNDLDEIRRECVQSTVSQRKHTFRNGQRAPETETKEKSTPESSE